MSKAADMTPQSLDLILQTVGIVSTLSGFVGSGSALIVDFYRRRVRAKAAEYAAEHAFTQVVKSVAHLQETLETHMQTSQNNHSDISQRVARLEGREQNVS